MLLISLTILLSGGPAWAQTGLEQRLNSWPDWSLPAPLPRPSNRDDLIYPDWFAGLWQVESIDLDAPDDPPLLQTADPEAALNTLLNERRPLYAEADLTVVINDEAPETVADGILQLLPSLLKDPTQRRTD